jgi:hypothetical protein
LAARVELIAERKACSEPLSAAADALRPIVARATTTVIDSHLLFPSIGEEIGRFARVLYAPDDLSDSIRG